jgi:hypothetical protein
MTRLDPDSCTLTNMLGSRSSPARLDVRRTVIGLARIEAMLTRPRSLTAPRTAISSADG